MKPIDAEMSPEACYDLAYVMGQDSRELSPSASDVTAGVESINREYPEHPQFLHIRRGYIDGFFSTARRVRRA